MGADTLDLRVKEELLTVVTDSQPESEAGPETHNTIETELNSEGTGTLATAPGQNGANGDTMIDTSDFRMSEPTYQTLTSVNGRMTPPGYHLQGHYATLTPPHYSQNNGLHAHMHQQHSPGTLSPQPYHQNGLHSPHKPMSPNPYDYTSRSNLDPQSPHDLSPNSSNLDNDHSPTSDINTTYSNATYTTTPLTSSHNPSLNGMASVSPHTISPVPHPSPSLSHHHRELSPPSPQSIAHPSPILPPTTILHHPSLPHHSQMNASLKSPNSSTSSNGEIEEINTKELAQRISAELKRYSIPQAIFAQRVLCRSQGTLSDLLRNPKPWSKLKSGRETFRRMFKWLQEPEFQRMSALRLAVMQQSAAEKDRGRSGESHHSHASSASSAKSRRKVPYSACHSFSSHW